MNWKVRLSDLPSQFRKLESQAMGTIHKVLSCGAIAPGRHLDAFEQSLASFTETTSAVALSSCFDAMQLVWDACQISEGDEVITVARCYPHSIEAIEQRGGKVVYVETDEHQLMDAEKVAAAVTDKTKVIMPVHLNGHTCDMNFIRLVAKKNDCLVVEDCTQAIGASCNGKQVGSMGTMAFFDLGPTSLMTGYGSAGAVVTNDEQLGEQLRALRDQGRSGDIPRCLDNVQAAILDLKLKHLPDDIRRRRELAAVYHREFRSVDGITAPPEPKEDGQRYDVFHNFEIQSSFRAELSEYLTSCGIEHELPATEQGTAVWLPIHPEMTMDNVQLVAQCVAKLHQTESKKRKAA